jgi:hypothetical protein
MKPPEEYPNKNTKLKFHSKLPNKNIEGFLVHAVISQRG